MAKLTELAMRAPQHVCIFGDSRSGKSELAASVATLPFVKKVIWISIDNGHRVLFKLPREAQEKIEIVVIPDTQQFAVAYRTCQRLIKNRSCKICDSHGEVDCSVCTKTVGSSWTTINLGAIDLDTVVVFDHISQLADSTMNHIMSKKASDEAFPGWDEFRLQGILMDRFLLAMQQAPYHVICVAQISMTKMEDNAIRIVPLIGTGPFSSNAAKYFDHTIYCQIVNKKHTFGSRSTFSNIATAGSRGDIAIEDSKEPRPSLLPFFEGRMDVSALPNAKEILEDVKEKVETKTLSEKETTSEEVLEQAPAVTESADTEQSIIQAELSIPNSNGRSVPAPAQIYDAERLETKQIVNAAEKAKERLRLMRESAARKAAGYVNK